MEVAKRIRGNSTEEVWQQLQDDFATLTTLSDYTVLIEQENRNIELTLGVHQGGSDEGGYEYTTLTSGLNPTHDFFFTIYPQDVFTEIGKIFGMQDIKTGYTEFDNQVIVKTNDPLKFRKVFSSRDTRKVFEALSSYSLKITSEKKKGNKLELKVQRAITDIEELKLVYKAFYQILALCAYITA
ncbi:hypothetical protein SAMN05421788_103344 [Filimonas lacunae]|uniref:Uncharacterized protein n=1 Tax=Filimonas lacunae TaxID=477680 RepID=A0A173MK39_9BACT|nr:hypothetical protein [Filimonas lacunae]BAV08003.1 hypothetical protein FLA_4036 [Filimonas lacunae]SIT07769.1 hypothetical protein SAMN05421788_103344 [Filimonas lacunae]